MYFTLSLAEPRGLGPYGPITAQGQCITLKLRRINYIRVCFLLPIGLESDCNEKA